MNKKYAIYTLIFSLVLCLGLLISIFYYAPLNFNLRNENVGIFLEDIDSFAFAWGILLIFIIIHLLISLVFMIVLFARGGLKTEKFLTISQILLYSLPLIFVKLNDYTLSCSSTLGGCTPTKDLVTGTITHVSGPSNLFFILPIVIAGISFFLALYVLLKKSEEQN